ncbi:Holliday junction branch migration protein RuvA [Aerococcus agrisoli]|uniref:Holliday junction branch migration complex subunit RuvA n=2 Tax=Aerococcus agrisoli TaxID=2487350 RepID=A0A3N4GHV6_9LACT|nr:Holliday junction branch migration protein RuvA [Aerococcus agrisoli]
MYEFMIGRVDSVYPDALVLETNGIGYYIYMANPYRFTDKIGQDTPSKIWLYQSVSENDIRLYGFKSQVEKIIFLQLISVSGIGPKSALSILSLDDNTGLVRAIEAEDATFLMKFPGVGKKTAGQIILDLKGKLVKVLALTTDNGALTEMATKTEPAAQENLPFMQELEDAMASLGYSQREIARVVKNADFTSVTTTADAIRIALKFITR